MAAGGGCVVVVVSELLGKCRLCFSIMSLYLSEVSLRNSVFLSMEVGRALIYHQTHIGPLGQHSGCVSIPGSGQHTVCVSNNCKRVVCLCKRMTKYLWKCVCVCVCVCV